MHIASIQIFDEHSRPLSMPSIVFPEKGLAIHRELNMPYCSPWWSVSHIQSGRMVCQGLLSYHHARRFVDRLPSASGIDFTQKFEDIMEKHYTFRRQKTVVRHIIQEVFKFTQEVKGEYVPRATQLGR